MRMGLNQSLHKRMLITSSTSLVSKQEVIKFKLRVQCKFASNQRTVNHKFLPMVTKTTSTNLEKAKSLWANQGLQSQLNFSSREKTKLSCGTASAIHLSDFFVEQHIFKVFDFHVQQQILKGSCYQLGTSKSAYKTCISELLTAENPGCDISCLQTQFDLELDANFLAHSSW